MSKINNAIPAQNFELVRDRIGEILADELATQFSISQNPDLNPKVWIERFVPFDKTEFPAINVTLSRGDYSNKDVTKADGSYIFNIDFYTSFHSRSHASGDALASITLQKIVGMCRYILEDPQYRTLGYASPFNCRTSVTSILIADPKNVQDTIHQMQGRILFNVSVPEYSGKLNALDIAGNTTQVKLALSDKGYYFEFIE